MRQPAVFKGAMRRPAPYSTQNVARPFAFAAPTGGWIANRNKANPNGPDVPPGAEVLENLFPTAEGAIMRRGSDLYATLGEGDKPTTALFAYKNGSQEELFGATEDAVYNVTSIVSPTNYRLGTEGGSLFITDAGDYFGERSTGDLSVITGRTGGAWVDAQFATSGGVFLVLVNGTDPMLLYDGSFWYPIGSEDVYRLAYDGGTAAFTIGQTVTGGTSGATAEIVNIAGDETSGTLIIHTIAGGPFQDNEALTDGTGGSALASGAEVLAYSGITGVNTADLDFVWVYKNRLFFVEKNSLDAWYLPVDSIGGAAAKIPLGGVMTKGGRLLFGQSWSLGTGESGGLSAQCIFATAEGQVAVFQGNNPASASEWSQVGVYRIGEPLGKQAFIPAGGDLVIATDIGFVPLSQAIQRDYAALSPSAVSYPIEDAWNDAVALRKSGEWHCEVWPANQMVVVALPSVNQQPPRWFVANTRTGAWGLFSNWDATCMEVFQGHLYFGSIDGKVVQANVTGQDEGKPYTATFVPLFHDLGDPTAIKIGKMARPVLRGEVNPKPRISLQSDYEINLPPPPASPSVEGSSAWGVGIWGTARWDVTGAQLTFQEWHVVGGSGYAVAPSFQMTSGAVVPLDIEIVRIDFAYSQSSSIV
ncbi:hypothetical protein GN330_22635 [Nitratireductor sp. CAU 1489]|uniref:Uncharacterized protein n=1 Tax=Nitratireductor arenosus TaxID=2682096 RepID=A0A844QQG2_9HYPH|nr:hypothetical protein [Nitratireductor arenosus]MVB00052.1 hypothetical protein [Nitratireductor arenosus]